VAFGFVLIALFVMVGALGIVIAVGLTALLALPPGRNLTRLFPLDLAHSVFLIFIAWAWASTIWSPYEQTGLALHMVAGALLYPLFVYGVFTLRGKARRIVILTALISAPFMLAPYLIEGTTGLISTLYAEAAAREAMLRDATRGVSAIVMATPALAALCVLAVTGRKGWVIAIIGVLLIALISVQFHLFAALIGLIFGSIIFAAGYKWPRSTILILTLSFLIMLLLAPMVMPVFAAPLDGMNLPLSWEWRVKMWPYTGQQINLHPLFGWGLEASRTFTEDHFKLSGFTLNYLVQHPHNVGLQVWLETGLIGALLLSTAIALFGIRLSAIPGLTRLQGAAISSSAVIILVFFSFTYGAWQEWLWASIAWVCALCVLVGTPRQNEGHP
jgi:O-antigen ligase